MIEPVKIEVKGVTDKEAFCKLLSQEFDVPVVCEKKGKVMTTNLDWLYENDRETLLTMTAGNCDDCKFENDCWNRDDYRCSREWLEAEYVEPDSWEKIEKDAALDMVDYCRTILKWNKEKIWYSTYQQMHNAVANDIVRRCKNLAGVE